MRVSECNKYICKIQFKDDVLPITCRDVNVRSKQDVREYLINKYKIDRKQILDIKERSEVDTYQLSYLGSSASHLIY